MPDEDSLRFGIFAVVFATMAVLEWLYPRRKRSFSRRSRWFTNLLISVSSTLCLRLLIPVLAIGAAQIVGDLGWGLFNIVTLPLWLELIACISLLDMLIYWQHVAFHKYNFLWSFHKVHHSDRDIDVTTSIRFHPVEIMLSMAYKICCVTVLGAPVLAVLIFEIVLSTCALFNHANFHIVQTLERPLRWILVTPDMHRIHHSVYDKETNSNYGFSISLWDRLFSSYTQNPRQGHEHMGIGLAQYQDDAPCSLLWSLSLPFQKRTKLSDTDQ